jgi:hypothetical protein
MNQAVSYWCLTGKAKSNFDTVPVRVGFVMGRVSKGQVLL